MHDHGECGVLGGLPGAGDADPVVDLDVGECGRGVVAQQDCRAGVEGRQVGVAVGEADLLAD